MKEIVSINYVENVRAVFEPTNGEPAVHANRRFIRMHPNQRGDLGPHVAGAAFAIDRSRQSGVSGPTLDTDLQSYSGAYYRLIENDTSNFGPEPWAEHPNVIRAPPSNRLFCPLTISLLE